LFWWCATVSCRWQFVATSNLVSILGWPYFSYLPYLNFGMNPKLFDHVLGWTRKQVIFLQILGWSQHLYSSRFWDGPETIEERGQVLRGQDKLRSMGQVNKFCGDQYIFGCTFSSGL
jgi:hypothetical protein